MEFSNVETIIMSDLLDCVSLSESEENLKITVVTAIAE